MSQSVKEGVSRLLTEERYAQGVQQNFAHHVQQHSQLDALERCKALNKFLAENVRAGSLLESVQSTLAGWSCGRQNMSFFLTQSTGFQGLWGVKVVDGESSAAALKASGDAQSEVGSSKVSRIKAQRKPGVPRQSRTAPAGAPHTTL